MANRNRIISLILKSKLGAAVLVFALPAVLFAAGGHPFTAVNASQCQEIVAAESALGASASHNRLSDVARARIANVCASSGAFVVKSLRHRSDDGKLPTLASLGGM